MPWSPRAKQDSVMCKTSDRSPGSSGADCRTTKSCMVTAMMRGHQPIFVLLTVAAGAGTNLCACEWRRSQGSLRRPLHGDDERLVLVGATVRHQCPRPAAAVVARKMRNLGRHQSDLTGLEDRWSLPLDLDRHASFNNKENFLGARMHVPGGCGARRHFQHVDHGLANFLILALQIR